MAFLVPSRAVALTALTGAAVTYFSRELNLNADAAKPLGITALAVVTGQIVSKVLGIIVSSLAPVDYKKNVRYTVHAFAAAGLTFAAKSFFKLSDKEALAMGALTTAVFLYFDKSDKPSRN